ncbi:MAG: DUF1499 domain-containing protein [Bdellovibrionales bacterium]
MKKLIGLISMALIGNACSGTRPDDLGVKDQRLKECPDKPNCVSSFSNTEQHKIEAFELKNTVEESKELVKSALAKMDNAELIKEEDDYLYYEFTTSLMRYVDDVEFYFNSSTKKIDCRSASRLGHSDLGLNRKRMELIRNILK